MSQRSHIANEAIRDALQLAEDIAGELVDELGQEIGKEEVSIRYVRGLARRALRGDTEAVRDKAMMDLIALASQQPDHGRVEPCEVCANVDYVLREEGQGQGGTNA